MADITQGTWIKDGKAVDAVYQSGVKVYGRNLLPGSNISKIGTRSSYFGLGATGTYTVDLFNSLRGKTITMSFDIEWSNWSQGDSHNRLGIEWQLNYSDGTTDYFGAWDVPSQESKSKHRCSATVTIPDKEIASLDEGMFYDEANCTATIGHAKIEVGNTSTPYSQAPEDI